MTVSDVMRHEVVTAPPDATADELATMMRDEDVGSVVVVRDDVPVGIVTDRDVAVRIAADGLDPAAMTAERMMTADPVTIEADSGLFNLFGALCEEGVRRMPVVEEDGSLAGIVTLDDLTVLLAGELDNLAGVIESESPSY
ncbi:MAG: CBS domain-containing protein [Halobellus sp.]